MEASEGSPLARPPGGSAAVGRAVGCCAAALGAILPGLGLRKGSGVKGLGVEGLGFRD